MIPKLKRLRLEEELLQGGSELYCNNECCADSLLQLLFVYGYLPPLDRTQRRNACARNREHLVPMHQNTCAHDDEMLSQGATAVWAQKLSCSMICKLNPRCCYLWTIWVA